MKKLILPIIILMSYFMSANAHDMEVTLQYTDDFSPLFNKNHQDYYTRNIAFWGGRGGQKSWQIGRSLLIRGLDEPCTILCAREFQSSIADSVLKLLEEQIFLLKLHEYYKVQRNYIEGINGTNFIFKGLSRNINSIKSIEGVRYCWVEEAQVVTEESWNILVPTIRLEDEDGKWTSQIISSFNPHLESDPTYQRYLGEIPVDDLYIRRVNYDVNPFFPKVLRKEMEWDRKHSYEKYLHVWEGVPLKRLESLVFTKWRIDGDIAPGIDETIRMGADFGFRDPSVLLRAWIDREKREIYIDHESYGVEVEIDDLPDFFKKVPGSNKWSVTADSSRPETISFLRRKGFKMKSTKKGKGSVEEGVEFLKSYTIVVHPRCVHLIAELGLYQYKTDKLTGEVLPILQDKDNHCIDALRYALEALIFKRALIHI